LYSSGAAVKVDVLHDAVIRVRLAPYGVFAPEVSDAVVGGFPEGPAPLLEERDDMIILKTSRVTVEIARSPLRIRFLDQKGLVINADDPERGMAWDGAAVRVWKTMPEEENYYGFGEKSGKLNKKFSHLTMWNTDIPAYTADTDPLYQTIPFFLALRDGSGHGIFFHNTYWSSFDMGKESRKRYSFGAEGGALDYYVIYGPDPKSVIGRYTTLVGRMPLPPLWSLGYQQCRWSYYPEERVRALADSFRTKKIPADVIYLDIDYMEGYRIFTWSRKNFPRPGSMISDLAADGFKIAVIIDPGIKQDSSYASYRSGLAGDHFLKYPDGRVFIGKVWPGECAFP
ncbi:MAG: glycoside hydrolase family 31 protein, partial [Proteobacteria bacterium]|nr:glycoside hydrolase family 31 protein [Pseudomonadota bacterium]